MLEHVVENDEGDECERNPSQSGNGRAYPNRTGRAGVAQVTIDHPPMNTINTEMANPSWEAQFQMLRAGQHALTTIEFSSKPIVMAIYDGICMGDGLELALSCHIRVAGKGSIFSVPEAVAGAMPGWGNTQRLVRYFGRCKAIELALTGCQISATEAHALGAVNHVVAGTDVFGAREIADGIARMRTKSIRYHERHACPLSRWPRRRQGNRAGAVAGDL